VSLLYGSLVLKREGGGGGGRIRIGHRGGNREGRKGMDERGRGRQKREGIAKLTIKESKEKTKETRHGAFWQHSCDKDHR